MPAARKETRAREEKKTTKTKKKQQPKKKKTKENKTKRLFNAGGIQAKPGKKKRNNKPATNTAVDSFFISTHKKKPNHQEMAAIK